MISTEQMELSAASPKDTSAIYYQDATELAARIRTKQLTIDGLPCKAA